MSLYLLDTNILTDLIKHPDGRVRKRIAEVGEENLCTSIVVACELRFGARKKNAPALTKRIEQLLQTIEVLPLAEDVDRTYAEVRTALEKKGRSIGANDLLIGAHALNERCVLVTHNGSELGHIAGLKIEDWLAH
ncbi:MAG TPA: type II toxin-antitoxin system VapC family toxin [Steroidobacteraceae bacterium]|nr:type II toxin-antitoxin system VapC family toxin [Steroidobacteraceae bacterium]